MRVIGGRLGGRRLQAPRGSRTRPTSEMVREAIFSMLDDVGGAVVLDLFAGTGAMGIEALSRGARRAVFIERDPGAFSVLQANLSSLELGLEQALARRARVEAAMGAARRAGETYDLVFIDPPYRHAPEWGPVLGAALPDLLSPGARVVVESDPRSPLELPLPVERDRRHGHTLITIHRQP